MNFGSDNASKTSWLGIGTIILVVVGGYYIFTLDDKDLEKKAAEKRKRAHAIRDKLRRKYQSQITQLNLKARLAAKKRLARKVTKK